ncbi:hypothetical protein CYY_003741 [Polysphondylium violaceum]|uniref:ABC transporter domain-containing protein n=1 Tax=Polysphondylium violaceum TaxID=133409 RepID=A0A8J4UU16_9MYCE|nr:hypothetical protein CYY_003741 [Polysphondylium violaceum]
MDNNNNLNVPQELSLSELEELKFKSGDLKEFDKGLSTLELDELVFNIKNDSSNLKIPNTNEPLSSESLSPPPLIIDDGRKISIESTVSENTIFESQPTHSYNFFNQFKALFLKSIAYQKRQYKTNIFQALVPVLMISIMSFVQLATPPTSYSDNVEPVVLPLPFVFPPTINTTVPYILLSDQVYDIGDCCSLTQDSKKGFLNYFSTSNQVSFIPDYYSIGMIQTQDFEFVEYPDKEYMDSTSYSQRDKREEEFLMALLINQVSLDPTTSSFKTNMVALSNNTLSSGSIINLLNNAFLRYYTSNPNYTITTNIKEFPYKAHNEPKDMIQPQENFWYLFMMSFCMVVFVSNVVYEKENRLREIMKMSGLRMHIYWLVNYIFNFSLYMIIVLVAIAYAYILKFRFYTQTPFSVFFVLFVLFGMTQIAFSFFISVFFSSVYTSTVVSFIYIIFTALSSNLLNNAFIENPDTSLATFVLTGLIPHVAYHRAISYISLEYVGNSPGLTWEKIFQHEEMPTLYGLLFGEFLIFAILHLYLEAVVPSAYGVKEHPLFFLKKPFWFNLFGIKILKQQEEKKLETVDYSSSAPSPANDESTTIEMVEVMAPDTREEKNSAYASDSKALIRLLSLCKTFDGHSGKIHAVDNLSFSVEKGQCVGLIGANGSGKTTTLNVLCGLYSPSGGNALINGYDIVNNIHMVHSSLGVCNQEDVLWSEMSGREHLQFFGRMKNLKGDLLSVIVDKALAEVMLTDSQHKAVREYSGGMKRRLSLAISLIGSPSIILLDEPTTGVDPFSRRIVWDVINSYKNRCAIILTTHNMEEAQITCDKVCIINKGSLKTVGRTQDLKARYGAGYTLSITTTNKESQIHEFITRLLPEAKLIHEISLNKTYAVPRSSLRLSSIFKAIQENKNLFSISDWGICQSGLEEVLLQATKERTSSKSL